MIDLQIIGSVRSAASPVPFWRRGKGTVDKTQTRQMHETTQTSHSCTELSPSIVPVLGLPAT